MAKSKTQPEEVVEAEAEDFVEVPVQSAPAPVPAGSNQAGEPPPSMR